MFPKFPQAVPIVGQPLKVLVAYASAVIECQCDAKTVMVLACTGRVSTCPGCGKMYAIAQAGDMQIGEVRSQTHADDYRGVLG
jgi:hypothetical protein